MHVLCSLAWVHISHNFDWRVWTSMLQAWPSWLLHRISRNSSQSSAPSALYSSFYYYQFSRTTGTYVGRSHARLGGTRSMLNPLVITASTSKHPSSLRTVRNHHSYPRVIQQPLFSIPECLVELPVPSQNLLITLLLRCLTPTQFPFSPNPRFSGLCCIPSAISASSTP